MANPLDRTWYNGLVDDDGSGSVGTIWNKAAVDALMDAVDAALVPVVDKTGVPAVNLLAIFNDADTLKATPNIGVDPSGGLKLDSPSYAYVQLNDQSQPTDSRLFRIVNQAGSLRLMALSEVGALLGQLELKRDGRLVPSTGQITFPTVQVPSADPSTLDAYKEVPWVPSWGGTTGNSGQTYTLQEATATRFGNRVVASGRILLATVGTLSGNLLLRGLPFPASGNTYNPGSLRWVNGGGFTLSASMISGIVGGGTTDIQMLYLPAGGAASYALMPVSAVQAGLDFFFELTYVTA